MIREPQRTPDWTARFFRFAGLPVFVLFTLVLHAWTVAIAWASGGASEGLVTLATPGGSWLLMVWRIGAETGTWATNYTVCVGVWFVSALMVGTAWWVNGERER